MTALERVKQELGWEITLWNGMTVLRIPGPSEQQGVWGATEREQVEHICRDCYGCKWRCRICYRYCLCDVQGGNQ